MGDITTIQMDEEERNEFLMTGGTGVISFSAGTEESPYTLPVSYGYDATSTRFYFRLASGPNSKKEEVIDRPISFVTYDKTEEGWCSVGVTGRLKEVAEADIDSDIVQGIRHVDIPIVDVFDRHPREVSFRFFHLDPDQLTSRKEP
ncbi:pyridoxamine 5'-phosphate oxidase family protein [Haladaptatus sp. DFWS20]|uniref:pyridoxamine 5'-phosphate oxidase family protein n=1 Tax=Haladaptatus sp. DFWS20 TaxID=3403467 RepID=UPI003EC0EEC0